MAKLVEPPYHEQRANVTWSKEQVCLFLDAASGERLHGAWRMSMYGLRRGEVLGLTWPAVVWGSFAEPCRVHREVVRAVLRHRGRVPPDDDQGRAGARTR